MHRVTGCSARVRLYHSSNCGKILRAGCTTCLPIGRRLRMKSLCLCSVLWLVIAGDSAPANTDELGSFTVTCPPIVFVKRPHFDRPFGLGTIIGWDIYRPGGGIYVIDPRHPDSPEREMPSRHWSCSSAQGCLSPFQVSLLSTSSSYRFGCLFAAE